MKQILILNKLLIVELMPQLSEIALGGKTILDFGNGIKSNKCLGKFDYISEEQWAEYVVGVDLFDSSYYLGYDHAGYRATAKESVLSAIRAKDYYIDGNPYEDSWNEDMGKALSYEQAESRVLDSSKCFVFEVMEVNNG
jgi:hypothetical protein